jgi:hypothetical protein
MGHGCPHCGSISVILTDDRLALWLRCRGEGAAPVGHSSAEQQFAMLLPASGSWPFSTRRYYPRWSIACS